MSMGPRKNLSPDSPIGTQIFFSRSHARVTLFSHIFTELQFHHHSFIICMRCFELSTFCTLDINAAVFSFIICVPRESFMLEEHLLCRENKELEL